MPQQQLILTIGRIERALSRLEQASNTRTIDVPDPKLIEKHKQLKAETRLALDEIDVILAGGGR
jgi:hypothetical protein